MTTRRRPLEGFALSLALSLALCSPILCSLSLPVCAQQHEVTVLIEGLSDPTGLAVRRLSEGPSAVEVFIAEAGAGAISRCEITPDGVSDPEQVITGDWPEPVSLGWFGEGYLLVASDRVTTHTLAPKARVVATAELIEATGAIRSLATDDRYLFALSGGRLLRARHASGRFTSLRQAPGSLEGLAAVAPSPRGYLTSLRATEAPEKGSPWTLSFHDPERPAFIAAEFEVSGLQNPVAMAYGRADGQQEAPLYVLQSDLEDPTSEGLYRIQADVAESGRLGTRIELIAPLPRPLALMATEQAIYVITHDQEGGGRLYRINHRASTATE